MKIRLFLFVMVIAFAICGCGRSGELDDYKDKMEVFFDRIDYLNMKINNIDPSAEDASAELLKYLDDLQASIDEMAAYEVPEQFSGVETLAAEASENMQNAVSLFHEAYEGESYKDNIADAAMQYYERVNVRLHYIVSILHGELPENED